MKDIWFDKLKAEMMSFIENSSIEELDAALEKANFSFYKTVKAPVLAVEEEYSFYELSLTEQYSSEYPLAA